MLDQPIPIPIPIPTPFYLAPLYSRGKFSPRLLAAWVLLLSTIGLEFFRATVPGEVIWANVALIAALFGLGTLQKIQLGDPTPSAPSPSGEGAPTE